MPLRSTQLGAPAGVRGGRVQLGAPVVRFGVWVVLLGLEALLVVGRSHLRPRKPTLNPPKSTLQPPSHLGFCGPEPVDHEVQRDESQHCTKEELRYEPEGPGKRKSSEESLHLRFPDLRDAQVRGHRG